MIGHYLIIFQIIISIVNAAFFTNQCPNYCVCDLTTNSQTTNTLTITCSQLNSNFQLPYYAPNLTTTSSIIAKFNYLQSMPSNLCQFQTTLRILDLSSNLITNNLTVNTLNCLIKLEFLNLSRNSIVNIDQNAFVLLGNLQVLDLSHNNLAFLPATLFSGFKLKNLKYLFLNNNFLTDIDVWFFYLNSIIKIDLSYNSINQFTNRIGYTPASQTSNQLANATLVDLRYNDLTRFDDSILSSYSICKASDLAYFFYLMSPVLLDQNPFNCSCSSYNMLMFYQTLSSSSAISQTSNIFKATCFTPSLYLGKNIFSFTNSNTCTSSGNVPIVYSCQTTTTVSTSAAAGTIANPNNPELLLGSTAISTTTGLVSDGQIAGVVVGFLALLALIIGIIYCMCPVEWLSCLFGLFPTCYTCCPCKSGVVTNKYYDVFISYNKSSDDYIRQKLVPFFNTKRPNDRYFLQYDSTNINQETFGSFTRGKMDNSAVILIVLSDKYLMKEWEVTEFRNHVRHLLTRVPRDKKDKTRLICIQLSDVCDEEVDDYVRHKIQIPRFISLEDDEYCFWNKLNYYLHSNKDQDPVIVPVNITEPVITVTSDESPRSEISPEMTNYKENFLLDEYSTSLEQIIYEKIPSLNMINKNESIHNIKYDHNSKKFTYTTKNDESKQDYEEQEQDEVEKDERTSEAIEKIRKKHKKNRRSRRQNESVNELEESSVIRTSRLKIKDKSKSKSEDDNSFYF